MVLNDVRLIDSYFDKRKVLKKYFFKFFNAKYGIENVRTVALSIFPHFTGFFDPHFAQGFRKVTLDEVWRNFGEALNETMHRRFRDPRDVNQWLFRYWHLCKGEFYPVSPHKGKKVLNLGEAPIDDICYAVENQCYSEIVINDNPIPDFEFAMTKLAASFEKILPEKSSFER